MSQWTHICGAIRYDGLQGMTPHPEEFGIHDGVPEGSEGPLNIDVWTNPETHELAAYCVTFRGDLRDFGANDVHELEEYFERIAAPAKGKMIRGGVIRTDIEYGPTLILNITDKGSERVLELPYESTG